MLLAEDDADFRELEALLLTSRLHAVVHAFGSGEEAWKFCQTAAHPLDLVVTDYDMPGGDGGELMRRVRGMHPDLPIVTFSGRSRDELPEVSSLTGVDYAQKPDVNRLIALIRERLGLGDGATQAAGDQGRDYHAVSLRMLKRMGEMLAPIYLKLGEGKFVKVIPAGQLFDDAEVKRFSSKEIQELYVHGDDLTGFLEKTAQRILQLAAMPAAKLTQEGVLTQLALSEGVLQTVQKMQTQLGFTPEVQQVAVANARLALQTLEAIPSLVDLLNLGSRGEEGYIYAHSVQLACVSGSLATSVGWGAPGTLLKLSLAAMLHDLALTDDDLARHRALDEVPSRDLQAFRSHPEKAAEWARQFRNIPADVDTIVAQHHEEPDGSGFPARLSHSQIAPLAAVMIVAHDLIAAWEAQEAEFSLKSFLAQSSQRYAHGVFRFIAKALAKEPGGSTELLS